MSVSIAEYLKVPVRAILGQLLPAGAVASVAAEGEAGAEERLVRVVDSLLVGEAPESRLLSEQVRQKVVAEVLEEQLAAPGNEDFSMRLRSLSARKEEGAKEVPVDEDALTGEGLAELGVRGFTVQAVAGVSEDEVAVWLKEVLGGGVSVERFPGLADTYTASYSGLEKPIVSQAYATADALMGTGSFVYVEPNIAVPVDTGEAVAPGLDLEGAGEEKLLGGAERVVGSPGPWQQEIAETAADYEWSLNRIHAKALWDGAEGSKGAGIRIGHIDTGYTLHPEVKDRLNINEGYDYWGKDADAKDPLKVSLGDRIKGFLKANPGHGTGTGSVIVSPEGHQAGTSGQAWVTGSAPEARLVPYRATPSVVIVPWGSQDEVARAILGAAENGVDVISMSLGSPLGSQVLRQAVTRALDLGVIVCAAAGNIVAPPIQGSRVTYPARYSGVVAVAGCDYHYAPWNRSCRGPEVDITAPGTNVWKAEATEDLTQAKVVQGSGTSFAVATVAGMAACWVARHGGRKALRQHYGGQLRLISVAFLLSLRRMKKIPLTSGDPSEFGQGIIHGGNLAAEPLPTLQEALGHLPQMTPQEATPLADLEGLSPAGLTEGVVASAFTSWTRQSVRAATPGQVRALALRVGGSPRLLRAWHEELGRTAKVLGTAGLAGLAEITEGTAGAQTRLAGTAPGAPEDSGTLVTLGLLAPPKQEDLERAMRAV